MLLVLVREGYMSKIAEKKWNARINTWLRAPPMTVYAFVGYQAWLLGSAPLLPLWAIIVVTFLVRWRGRAVAWPCGGLVVRGFFPVCGVAECAGGRVGGVFALGCDRVVAWPRGSVAVGDCRSTAWVRGGVGRRVRAGP